MLSRRLKSRARARLDIPVDYEANTYTIDGLVAGIVEQASRPVPG